MKMTNFQSQFKSNQGFTLIEMLVVVAIIAILAALAYPSMQRQLAELRIKSAKESIAAAFKDAQAQSIILRKPIWVVVEKEASRFALTITDTDPTAGTAVNVISKTSLNPSIRLVGSDGAEVGDSQMTTLKSIRVTPAGNFEMKSDNAYSTGAYDYAFCDTGYKSLKVKPVRFDRRSLPISSKSSDVPEITCNLS